MNANSQPTLLDNMRSLRRTYEGLVTRARLKKKASQSESDFQADCYKLFTSTKKQPWKPHLAARLWSASGCDKFVKTEAGDSTKGFLPSNWDHWKAVVLRSKETFDSVSKLLKGHADALYPHPAEAVAKKEMEKLAEMLGKSGGGSELATRVKNVRSKLFQTFTSKPNLMPVQHINRCIKETSIGRYISEPITGPPGKAIEDANFPMISLVNLCSIPHERWNHSKVRHLVCNCSGVVSFGTNTRH